MKKLIICTIALIAASANAGTIEMKVYGLVCGFCAQGIEKTLRKNPATRDGADISDAELTKALTDSGYDVKGITRTQRSLAEIRAGLGQAAK